MNNIGMEILQSWRSFAVVEGMKKTTNDQAEPTQSNEKN